MTVLEIYLSEKLEEARADLAIAKARNQSLAMDLERIVTERDAALERLKAMERVQTAEPTHDAPTGEICAPLTSSGG